MRYLSLFSGIEAATVAWRPLGWECVGVAEIEAFPSCVLKHHYPDVPNLGDITKITAERIRELGRIDLVVGGFPCQDLSVAGQRKGLRNADGTATRSGLFFDAMRIVEWAGPRWVVIENVPGLFSSNAGRDFASVVGELAGTDVGVPQDGWRNTGVAAGRSGLVEWSVLDAQWFGLAQRRKRVFLVRDSGDWRRRPPLLLERESLCGHPAPRREAGKGVAGCFTAGAHPGSYNGQDAYNDMLIAHALRADGFDASEDGTGRGTPSVAVDLQNLTMGGDVAGTLDTTRPTRGGGQAVVAFQSNAGSHGGDVYEDLCPTLRVQKQNGRSGPAIAIQERAVSENPDNGPQGKGWQEGVAFTLEARNKVQSVANRTAVRRLTPRECARLQGFPDDYLDVIHRGKPAADGPRYKALGNSFAVPVVRWIGERIAFVDTIKDTPNESLADAGQ